MQSLGGREGCSAINLLARELCIWGWGEHRLNIAILQGPRQAPPQVLGYPQVLLALDGWPTGSRCARLTLSCCSVCSALFSRASSAALASASS